MTPRVLVPGLRLAAGRAFDPPPDVLHYLRFTLRLKPGAPLVVVDGGGAAWDAVLAGTEDGLVVDVRGPAEGARVVRQDARWVLVLGLLKGDHTELAIQKSTEAGVAEVRVAVMDRSIPRPAPREQGKRLDRLSRVAFEATRQCGRAAPPPVGLHGSLDAAIADLPADLPRFLLDEAPDTPSLARALAAEGGAGAVLVVGPEGSLSDRERAVLLGAGFRPAGLGPRVLRAETAAIAAVVVAQVVAGDLG